MGVLRRVALVMGLGLVCAARGQQPVSPDQVLHVETRLVVLDATVVDKAGRPVAQPLRREDFVVKEDHQLQTIYSFESAAEHASADGSEEPTLMIFVLDELNYQYLTGRTEVWNEMEQFAQYRYAKQQLMKFSAQQPAQLHQRTEVLALTHHGYRVVSQPTRDREDLMARVKSHDPGLGSPFRDFLEETGGGGVPDYTLTNASIRAIWSLALQLRGVPGRKLVLWLGNGGPDSFTSKPVSGQNLTPSQRHARQIIDLLVDARVTLDICGPGISVAAPSLADPRMVSAGAMGTEPVSYGYERDFGFSGFVSATGGTWWNGNDIRGEIQTSANFDTTYYTLSYRPTNHESTGDFRKIEVSIKGHPEWTVMTKSGYFGMPFGGEKDALHRLQTDLRVAAFEAMPYGAIGTTLELVERLKDSDLARFTFRLNSDDLQWNLDPEKNVRKANVAVAGSALGSVFESKALTARVGTWNLSFPKNRAEDEVRAEVALTLPVTPGAKRLRFVFEDMSNGRMGAVDVPPSVVENAPTVEPPTPGLVNRLP